MHAIYASSISYLLLVFHKSIKTSWNFILEKCSDICDGFSSPNYTMNCIGSCNVIMNTSQVCTKRHFKYEGIRQVYYRT
jgi:hypothetical protein